MRIVVPFSPRETVTPDPEAPAEFTGQEARYLKQLAQEKTPVVVHLLSGEEFRGWIEYFDVRFIRLTSNTEPNRFIFKNQIKYIVEAGGS